LLPARSSFGDTQRFLETDPIFVEALTILDDRHPHITISNIFDDNDPFDRELRNEYRQKFDRLLGLLWRLCYAYLGTKTLSRTEIEAFGWYLWRISESSSMVDYCENFGFDDITTVIKELRPIWEKEDAKDG
jgi:hypothetical protein